LAALLIGTYQVTSKSTNLMTHDDTTSGIDPIVGVLGQDRQTGFEYLPLQPLHSPQHFLCHLHLTWNFRNHKFGQGFQGSS
jgi:hypothetical protein